LLLSVCYRQLGSCRIWPRCQLQRVTVQSRLAKHFSSMLFFSWLSCLFFAALVVAKEAPTELVINTTYLPDDCTAKAKKGDKISVHYVSIRRRDSDATNLTEIMRMVCRVANCSRMTKNLTPGSLLLICRSLYNLRVIHGSFKRGTPLPLTRKPGFNMSVTEDS
jgi:hypothetical protein